MTFHPDFKAVQLDQTATFTSPDGEVFYLDTAAPHEVRGFMAFLLDEQAAMFLRAMYEQEKDPDYIKGDQESMVRVALRIAKDNAASGFSPVAYAQHWIIQTPLFRSLMERVLAVA